MVKAAERETAEASTIKARDEILHHKLQTEFAHVHQRLAAARAPPAATRPLPAGTEVSPTATTRGTVLSPGDNHQPRDSRTPSRPSSSRDREATPRRRSEEPPRPCTSRSPLGKGHYTDDRAKEHRKAKRLEDEDAMRETTRAAVVEQKREKSSIFNPDMHAILSIADASRTKRGLSAHTLTNFLIHMQEQGHFTQAAHQNETPQNHMEQDLHPHHGRSQGAPLPGHCQRGHH